MTCGSVHFYTRLRPNLPTFTQQWLRVFYKCLLGKGMINICNMSVKKNEKRKSAPYFFVYISKNKFSLHFCITIASFFQSKPKKVTLFLPYPQKKAKSLDILIFSEKCIFQYLWRFIHSFVCLRLRQKF